MTDDEFERAALALPGVELDVKWETDRTFCVGSKIFAFARALGEAEPRFCLKATSRSPLSAAPAT